MYLCSACHALKGRGFASENLTIYEKHLGKYVEVLMEYNMNATEVRNLIDQCKKQAHTSSDSAQMVLIGEIAAQLATLNVSIQANTTMMASFIERISHGPENPDNM